MNGLLHSQKWQTGSMVRIVKISKPQVEELVKLSYRGDNDLCEKYHSIKGTYDELAKETMALIEGASKVYELEYYKVIINNQPIGYFITSKKLLYSFGINMNFRKKDILVSWWENIKSVLGKAFTAILYDNNTRAISFLEKQGMELYKKHGNLITLINFK